jgi:putative membrane protein
MAYPVREVFVRVARVRGFWGYYLPLDVMMSFSMLYELLEWGIAVILGGGVGQSYLGTQGDEWDAHKDMALATLGGLIAITITMLVNWRFHRDFAVEFAASLTPDHPAPQGSGDA